ncbi:hypothetical protein [uncultured Pseudomonas sp.]|uniref:hypothetical protein n=1 Tax=uncultured Pseudomonas sp. TaxID=114707 RepID=UPI0025EB7DCD|nr:hypothetical protein [uncultured Pseudomonas sp.]
MTILVQQQAEVTGRRPRFDLSDLDALRERRDELLMAVEQAAALIQVEEMEVDPDLDWLRRAKSFMLQGKAMLWKLDQHDREKRRQEVQDLARGIANREGARINALKEVKAWREKAADEKRQKLELVRELKQVRHFLGNATREVDSLKRKRLKTQEACDAMSADLRALRTFLGAEVFDRVIKQDRLAREAEKEKGSE